MGTWLFEPAHTAAMFRARHMMVTYVPGHFKNVSGSLVFDPENSAHSSADVAIDAAAIWTGQPQRDPHLRSADSLDVENHPRITFKGNQVFDHLLHNQRIAHDIECRLGHRGPHFLTAPASAVNSSRPNA